jgi:SNF2 family DNA or RNA helicase
MPKFTLQKAYQNLAAEKVSRANKKQSNVDSDGYDFSVKFPTVYNYQKKGVEFLSDKTLNRRILADDMGLGKTLQVLASFDKQTEDSSGRLLIVTTKNAKATWRKEIKKWLGKDAAIIEASQGLLEATRIVMMEKAPIVSVNFESIPSLIGLLQSQHWDYIVVDEAHKLRNRDTKMYKACAELFRHFQMVPLKLVTGTPLINSPRDLYSLLHLLYPSSFTSEERWINEHFKVVDDGPRTKKSYTHRSPKQFKEYMSRYMLRRIKEDVLDLPDLREITVPIELEGDQAKYYNMIRDSFRAEFEGKESISASILIAQVGRLKQVALSLGLWHGPSCEGAKTEKIMEILEESEEDEKFVITSMYADYLRPLAKKLEEKGYKVCCLTGRSTTDERFNMEKNFNDPNSGIKVFLFSTKAGGESLTLTAASTIIFTDKPWTDAAVKQAIGRINRIGQNKKMTAITLQAVNTVEEWIESIIEMKAAMFNESIPVTLVRRMLFGE